jgi:Ferric uptake regulator family
LFIGRPLGSFPQDRLNQVELVLVNDGGKSSRPDYLIKEDDLFIGFTTVYRTLKTIVACGLGKEVISADAITRYVHDNCRHRHLVCKDYGAVVEEQNASREAPDAD